MEQRFFYVYLVASRSRTLYAGFTGHLSKRVWEHKHKAHDGFSARYNCDRLVWFEEFATALPAIAREKQIKRWSRAKKIELIRRENPTWVDLSDGWEVTPRYAWPEVDRTLCDGALRAGKAGFSTALRSGRNDEFRGRGALLEGRVCGG